MTDERRFVGYLAGWTFLTTVCVTAAGVAAETAGPLGLNTSYLVVEGSGPAARLASHLPSVFVFTAAVVLALAPVVVAAVLLRQGMDPVATGGLLVAGLALFPGLVFALSPSVLPPSVAVDDAVVGIGVVVASGIALATLRVGVPSRRTIAGQFAHVGLAVVVLIGSFGGVALGVATQGVVVQSDRVSVPQTAFEVNYTATEDDRAVVTVTHAGGEAVPVERLALIGDGFANASSADQTAPGPWQGSVSGEDRTVVEGDAVSLGVESDCTVRVVYEYAGTSNTIGMARCEELR